MLQKKCYQYICKKVSGGSSSISGSVPDLKAGLIRPCFGASRVFDVVGLYAALVSCLNYEVASIKPRIYLAESAWAAALCNPRAGGCLC